MAALRENTSTTRGCSLARLCREARKRRQSGWKERYLCLKNMEKRLGQKGSRFPPSSPRNQAKSRRKLVMADVTAQMVKDLRDRTGAPFLDCKKALEEVKGDFEKAAEILRIKGLAKAAKKVGK